MTLILGFMVVAVLSVLGVVFDGGTAQKVWAAIGFGLIGLTVFVMIVGMNAKHQEDLAASVYRAEARAHEAEVAARPLNWGLPLIKVRCE